MEFEAYPLKTRNSSNVSKLSKRKPQRNQLKQRAPILKELFLTCVFTTVETNCQFFIILNPQQDVQKCSACAIPLIVSLQGASISKLTELLSQHSQSVAGQDKFGHNINPIWLIWFVFIGKK